MPVEIQSVTRALRILDTLAQFPDGLGVVEIARQVGLNVSTTHHLVNTLCASHYAGRVDGGAYRLGHAVPRLYGAYLVTQQPEARLIDVLNQLVSATRETGYLVVWQEDDVVIQAIAEGSHQLRVGSLGVGYRGHAHARAAAKALLAYLSPARLDAYLDAHPLDRLTPHTICDKAALKTHLRQIARQGYSTDREEFSIGIGCVAAPIFSASGQAVAALSMSAPEWRLSENFKAYVGAVTRSAQEASAILGYRPADGRSNGRGTPRKVARKAGAPPAR
jgi:DNA-binding IclR family transcriptional regulator